jgi:hypothetical protein
VAQEAGVVTLEKGEGPRVPESTDDGAQGVSTPPSEPPSPSSSADPYDNLIRCTNCKELQRAGYLCSNCGKRVPKPVDKYPGQTDVIPFRPTSGP